MERVLKSINFIFKIPACTLLPQFILLRKVFLNFYLDLNCLDVKVWDCKWFHYNVGSVFHLRFQIWIYNHAPLFCHLLDKRCHSMFGQNVS